MWESGWTPTETQQMFDAIGDGTLTRIDLNVPDGFIGYENPLQSRLGTVLLVLNGSSSGLYHLKSPSQTQEEFSDNSWLSCSREESFQCVREGASGLYYAEYSDTSRRILEAYFQPTPEICKLQFSLPLCWTVTCLNLLKGLLMLLIATGDFKDPLFTIGDAVTSFLQRPDPHTKSMSLHAMRDFRRSRGRWHSTGRTFKMQPRLKLSAASNIHWCSSMILYVSGDSVRRYMLTWTLVWLFP
jgi:hypothetical protein